MMRNLLLGEGTVENTPADQEKSTDGSIYKLYKRVIYLKGRAASAYIHYNL